MSDFAHLHVASGFSMRYGSATPQALVERAAQYGQSALALTDRDGLYGAIRFVQAATKAGIAAVLGVDLAMSGGLLDPPPDPAPPPVRRAPRAPARGGALGAPRQPRGGGGPPPPAGGPRAPRGARGRGPRPPTGKAASGNVGLGKAASGNVGLGRAAASRTPRDGRPCVGS